MGPEDRFSLKRQKVPIPQRPSCSVAVITRMRRTVCGSARMNLRISLSTYENILPGAHVKKRAVG